MQVRSIRLNTPVPAWKNIRHSENDGSGSTPEGVFVTEEVHEGKEDYRPADSHSATRVRIGINAKTRQYSASITEFNAHVGLLNIAEVALELMFKLSSEMEKLSASSGTPEQDMYPIPAEYQRNYEEYQRRRNTLLDVVRELPASMDIGVTHEFALVPETLEDSTRISLQVAQAEIADSQDQLNDIKRRLGILVGQQTQEREPELLHNDSDYTLEDEINEMIGHAGYAAIHVQANLDPIKVFELLN